MQKHKIRGERKTQLFLIIIAILIKKDKYIEFLNSVFLQVKTLQFKKPVKTIPDFRGSWSNRVFSKVSGFSLWYIKKVIYWTSCDVVMVMGSL